MPLSTTQAAAPLADSQEQLRHVFVRDLVLDSRIGVHQHERLAPQRVRVNLDLGVWEGVPAEDRLDRVVCYETIIEQVRAAAGESHLNLVETLAEHIAEVCLDDPRVRVARIRVEKLDVFTDAASVGVEIERISPYEVPRDLLRVT